MNIKEKYSIISIIGPHAGETNAKIIRRKIDDISKSGVTFWLIRSYYARPDMVRDICVEAKREGNSIYCYFIEPSSLGGASPTKTCCSAKMYSTDKIHWSELPEGLTLVTGKIDRNAYALVFDEIRLSSGALDLWTYVNFFDQSMPLRIRQGGSTVCAVKRHDNQLLTGRMKSRFRNTIAVGRLREPFGVWLK
ncbi:MAG: hypothetical protein ACE15F_24705 [bacterium]